MPRHIARYTVTSGLAGCYLPDSASGPMEFHTRKALASYIREELTSHDFPEHLFASVGIRGLWNWISRHGSSIAHFRIEHKGREIAFHGLTEDEFNEQSREAA